MKKRMILAILCLSLLIVGGITAYVYLGEQEHSDYSNGMFVDRSDFNGYATMYNLYTNV